MSFSVNLYGHGDVELFEVDPNTPGDNFEQSVITRLGLDALHVQVVADVPPIETPSYYNPQTSSNEPGKSYPADYSLRSISDNSPRYVTICPAEKIFLRGSKETVGALTNEKFAKFQLVRKRCTDIDHCPKEISAVTITGKEVKVEYTSTTTMKQLYEKLIKKMYGESASQYSNSSIKVVDFSSKKEVPPDDTMVVKSDIWDKSRVVLIVSLSSGTSET